MSVPEQPRVAYFCMEYGLGHQFALYAGGLGILAGDIMKAAGDLKLPMVGVGLVWAAGYTRQCIDSAGQLTDEPVGLARRFLKPLDVEIEVELRGKPVACRAFRVIGFRTAPLYLLEPRDEEHRAVTQQLYGGTSADRVAQEILLGVGGVRLLEALDIEVDVYHFNEGHAVFAGHELIRRRMTAGDTFAEARDCVRKQIVFTTHTPVAAGNETHSLDTLEREGASLGLTHEQLCSLGGETYSMTAAGLRLARRANAVSKLHADTVRAMWQDLDGSSSIVAITNGVHRDTWQDARVRVAMVHHKPRAVRRRQVWAAHVRAKRELLDEIRIRSGVDLAEDRLLIGFARRAAEYKRAMLVLSDIERIEPLLEAGRLQLVFAGKAHPADGRGKAIVGQLIETCRRYPRSMAFLEDHDIRLGALLTRGCDVWLNTPRRPMEASGTSGMKAAMNGVLNASTPDGWWPEGCVHGQTGWRIGTADTTDGDSASQDRRDRNALLSLLEAEIIPRYCDGRDAWIDMMVASIEMAEWQFCAARMVEDYYDLLYAASR